MFTEEFAILGKIPLNIVRIKSQQTKSNFKWWFGSLSQSFFSSATQIIIRFCTGPNHHYFPSDRLYSLIGVITYLATLWLVRLSLTLQCWLVVWLFSIMDFQMSLQSACMRRCIIALVAFVWLFSTAEILKVGSAESTLLLFFCPCCANFWSVYAHRMCIGAYFWFFC